MNNLQRIGNFTSSEIVKLLSTGSRKMTDDELKEYKKQNPKGRKTTIESWPGDAAKTYIDQKRREKKLKRTLNDTASARPLTWGKVGEIVAFDKLGYDYRLTSKTTIIHPKYPFWSGTPDVNTEIKVSDIKCPYTLDSFTKFAECKDINEVREKHSDGEKYYWQIVSNAAILGLKKGELIIFCPYFKELAEMKEACEDAEFHPNEVSWIVFTDEENLPYVPDDSEYKNLYKFEFDIPQEDFDLLELRVKQAAELRDKND